MNDNDLISRAAALEVIDAVKGYVWSQSEKVLCAKIYSQIKDILAVDKAQEPRVMTLEDVMKRHFNDVVYYEKAVSGVVIPAIVIDVIEHMPDGDIGIAQFRMIQEPTANCDLKYYGKTWRCWTAKPTEKRRRAVPWQNT